jgi:hypothetical protein
MRHPYGQRHHNAKLSDAEAVAISTTHRSTRGLSSPHRVSPRQSERFGLVAGGGTSPMAGSDRLRVRSIPTRRHVSGSRSETRGAQR